MGAEGGSFLAAGAELQLLPGKPSLLSAAKPFQPCPSPLCFSNFSFCITGITACRCGHCTRQTLTPSVLVGAVRLHVGAWSGEAEGGDRHRETFLHSSQLPLQGACSPSFSLSAQT